MNEAALEQSSDDTVAPPSDDGGRRQRSRRQRTRRQRRRRRLRWLAVAAPLIVVALLVGAWAFDSRDGRVVRNVELGGRAVGGSSASELDRFVADLATEYEEAPVRIVTPDETYETTAANLGLTLDQRASVRAAEREGRREPFVLRPFTWLVSLVRPRQVPLRFDVDEAVLNEALITLEGERRVVPVEPTIQAAPDGLVAVPGTPGSGLPAGAVADRLAATASTGDTPIEVRAESETIDPTFTEAAAQAVADEANALAARPFSVTVAGQARPVAPEVIRTWVRAVPQGDELALQLDAAAVTATVTEMFADIGQPPVNARFDLVDGQPVVVPSQDGVACCEPTAADKVTQAMLAAAGGVELAATATPADFTTAQANAFGIVQAVGGARAWPVSREASAAPGFTTFHNCCEARVTNIHRIADLVRGAIIPPGGTFSVNDHVGRRTTENGFVSAGAIRDGQHVNEVGGGVSQFATTLFNAAYFAGLDIAEYQAHSEYISRYPRGREATMGFPNPDLVIANNTPHGVMIWTSYTGSSLTITMYSTPFATGEQTGSREGRSGNCTVVTTTRTRTFVDGRPPVTDTFRATYRPGEGIFC